MLDGALMFSTVEVKERGGLAFGVSCGIPYLAPDPAARWVRFVFNLLRDDCVEIRWRDKPTGPADFVRPLYGDAVMRCEFAAASAIAIKRAGLVSRRPAVVASPPPQQVERTDPPRNPRGRPRNGKWLIDQSISEAIKAGEPIERLAQQLDMSEDELQRASGRHRTRLYREAQKQRTK